VTPRKVDASGLASALASLPTLDRDALLERWRALYGKPAPSHISRPILVRAIAYRMQEQVFGGLKPASRRLLQRVAEEIRSGRPITSVQSAALKPGTRLLRAWNGTTHEVIVLENGVLFRGQHHRSLSKVARLITGSRRSGPRFFGSANQPKHLIEHFD
jgi:hypothetical protein